MSDRNSTKILYFVTVDWFFCSHFIDRAVAAREAGYDVCVVTRVKEHGPRIIAHGLKLVPLDLERQGMNPWSELGIIRELVRIYKTEKPDIVHHVALKPIIYGTIAGLFVGIPTIINAPVGMGYVFTSTRRRIRLVRHLVLLAWRVFVNPSSSRVILENHDDLRMLTAKGLVRRERVSLIRGAGVDTNLYQYSPEPAGVAVVMLAARMLWDKGVREFVEAARLLRKEGISARFVLVGDSDAGNPTAIPRNQLEAWNKDGVIEWWGYQDDMPRVLAQANIVCLPSYREGLPKVLIEAAAAGRAIVTTDVPGCREVVRHGMNGLLVPVRDSMTLSAALARLIEDPALRQQMGCCGRQIAESEFSAARIMHETLAVYRASELSPH